MVSVKVWCKIALEISSYYIFQLKPIVKLNENSKSRRYCNHIENIKVIKAKLLFISQCHEASFLLSNQPIKIELGLEQPLATKNSMILWFRNECPSSMLLWSLVFISHGWMPCKNLKCHSVWRWFVGGSRSKKIENMLEF